VVKRLIEITESNSRLVTSPTLREADGLAMSSRNQRLDKESRNTAPAIFQTLLYLKTNLKKGPLVSMKEEAGHMLLNHGFRIDYIEIADLDNLDILDNWNGSNKLIALIAVFIKGVRLIDNMIITDN
jgi:pantoate--beta-alanine ligase